MTEEVGVAQKEIRYKTNVIFWLLEYVVEIRHQHKMVGIGQMIHACLIGHRSIEHLTFIQLANIMRESIRIRSEQQAPAIEGCIYIQGWFRKTG